MDYKNEGEVIPTTMRPVMVVAAKLVVVEVMMISSHVQWWFRDGGTTVVVVMSNEIVKRIYAGYRHNHASYADDGATDNMRQPQSPIAPLIAANSANRKKSQPINQTFRLPTLST